MAAHASPAPRSHSPVYASGSSSAKSSTPRLTVETILTLLNDKARFVSFSVDHDNFEKSSLELLEIVFPEWFISGTKHLKLAQCTEGITNKRKIEIILIYNLIVDIFLIFSHEM